MEWVQQYFVTNFILIFIAIVMYVSSFIRYKEHPRVSVYTILIMTVALSLSVFQLLENYGKANIDPTFTLVFSVLGYIFRPVCVYLFFLLNDNSKKGKLYFLTAIPLILNTVIYLLAFSSSIGQYIVYFDVAEVEGGYELAFHGGVLRFSSHVIALAYILWLLYLSLTTVKFKRIFRSLTVLTCATLIIISVVIESFFNNDGKISILYTAIALCVLTYYFYLSIENAEIDPLTGLYNGEVYNEKIDKLDEMATGLILFKINQNTEDEGNSYEIDKALIKDVAHIILNSINRKMIVYRIEETTFILITSESKEETIIDTYENLKKKFYNHSYKVDMGYSLRKDKNMHMHDLYVEAERILRYDKNSSKSNQVERTYNSIF